MQNGEIKHTLYWIRLPNHADPLTEGYIGVSNDPDRRLSEHQIGNSIVSKFIRKHKISTFDVIKEGMSRAEALALELSYRPKPFVGWNQAEGGGAPPSNKGKKRPEQSRLMLGENNPSKRPEVREKISKSLRGRKVWCEGIVRPEHSEVMKKKRGEEYPRFSGWYLTPWGRFSSYEEACSGGMISVSALYKYCRTEPDKIISPQAYLKSKYLSSSFSRDVVGKTYKEIGFDYEAN